MGSSQQNRFKYNGISYTFLISFTHPSLADQIVLDNATISKFQYTNEMNSLYLTGFLECVDIYGRIDALLDKSNVQCQIIFSEMTQKFDGNFASERTNPNKFFKHNFIVESIEILNRNKQEIYYKINLSSINKLKCLSNISYTNYNTLDINKKNALNIIKSCIQQSGLNIDKNSFTSIKTTVNFDYSSGENDNVCTVLKHILNKLYYYSKKEEHFQTIVYNNIRDEYRLFDLTDKLNITGIATIILSLMQSTTEYITTQEPNNLGIVTRFPALQQVKALFTHNFTDYNINNNAFKDATIKSNQLVQHYNTTFQAENIYKKYNNDLSSSELTFQTAGSYWNNDFSIYDDFQNCLFKNNALIVNTGGTLVRIPGAYVSVSIDRDTKQIVDYSPESYKDVMNRYKGLEGLWIVSRVTNIVEPAKERYRQNMVLFRNFLNK